MKNSVYTPKMLANLATIKSHLHTMDGKIRELEDKVDILTEKRNALNYIISDLDRIKEFYNGVALTQWTDYGTTKIRAVPTVGREAEIFHNASVPDKENNFGWYASVYFKGMSEGKKWMGVGYTFEEAVILAKDWITTGISTEGEKSRL